MRTLGPSQHPATAPRRSPSLQIDAATSRRGGRYAAHVTPAAIRTFNRETGGLIAWDRVTGSERWRRRPGRGRSRSRRGRTDHGDQRLTAINASPVIADGVVYVANGPSHLRPTAAIGCRL